MQPRRFNPDHPTIIAIQAIVNNEPGIQAGAVAKRIGNSRTGCVRYHIDRLVCMGLIREAHDNRHLFLFPKDWTPGRREAFLRNRMTPGQRAVFETVQRTPGITFADIARATGRRTPTVAWHLQRLQHHAKVRIERTTKENHVWPL